MQFAVCEDERLSPPNEEDCERKKQIVTKEEAKNLKGNLSTLVPGGTNNPSGRPTGGAESTIMGGSGPARGSDPTTRQLIGVSDMRPGLGRPEERFSRSTLLRLSRSVGRCNILRPLLMSSGGSCFRVVTNRHH